MNASPFPLSLFFPFERYTSAEQWIIRIDEEYDGVCF